MESLSVGCLASGLDTRSIIDGLSDLKPIRTYWTDIVAGPDIEKSEIILAVYGVDE
jgi:hypothetical protein